MKNSPLILLVNDDGIFSPGLRFLIKICKKIGRVCVVAPDKEQSGRSHAITVDQKITFKKIECSALYSEYSCSGTPVDCVKLSIDKILPRLPDLCVSGVNHGSNHSINSLYSGTLHGAMEGTIHGIPSLSFSHLSYSESIDLSGFKNFIKMFTLEILNSGVESGVTLNINIPDVAPTKIKGLKICKQGVGNWKEDFCKTRIVGDKQYYSVTGKFNQQKNDLESDTWALENNFISIVPITLDLTSGKTIDSLKYLEKYDF